MIKVSPSILSADFAALGEDIAKVAAGGADMIHIDVMDGHFVPNLTFGAPVIKCLRKTTDKPFDVHLMVQRPEDYIKPCAQAGADIFTFHIEAAVHANRVIQEIKNHGMKAGVALNPGTSLHSISEIIGDVDMVLLMTVNPGFGGQTFIDSSVNKIKRLRDYMNRNDLHIDIEVDGGINMSTAGSVVAAGANVLVAGSAIYNAAEPAAAIASLKQPL